MNNTTKAKYDVAERMLKGRIDVEEVSMITGLPLDKIKELAEKVTPNNADVQKLESLDNDDLQIGQILIDNLPAESEDPDSIL